MSELDLEMLEAAPPWDWPANAAEVLLESLRDRSRTPAERLAAARLAGEPAVIDEALAEALLGIVRSADEPDELRGQAAISLGPVLETVDVEGEDFPEDIPVPDHTFRKIVDGLREVYEAPNVPKLVRRRVLEGSVRAPRPWHADAIREASASGDPEWMVTAVFAMRWVRGFEDEIVEALESRDEDLRYEAVQAAGSWQIDAAWPYVERLLTSESGEKALLLAAIDAAGSIRPSEAGEVLADLAESDDEDIAEAAREAIAIAEALEGEGFEFEAEEDDFEDELEGESDDELDDELNDSIDDGLNGDERGGDLDELDEKR
ncbi:MAG TPA: HEAT repeat domain-containing protein [Gammaproteobacteria bacterium]|nr:HEAT repeat domain-containing protein [Gammaproteobacteria bacterium]